MENNNNSTTTLIIAVILAFIIGGAVAYYLMKDTDKNISGDSIQETQNSNYYPPVNQTENSNTSTKSNTQTSTSSNQNTKSDWKTFSANGMSLSAPSIYEMDTQVARAAGNSAVALNIGYSNKMIISMYKFNSKAAFEESTTTQGSINYSVNGIPAYITSSDDETYISIPSKFIFITVSSAAYVGVPQSIINDIVASIKI